jgi:hypothetical protein
MQTIAGDCAANAFPEQNDRIGQMVCRFQSCRRDFVHQHGRKATKQKANACLNNLKGTRPYLEGIRPLSGTYIPQYGAIPCFYRVGAYPTALLTSTAHRIGL